MTASGRGYWLLASGSALGVYRGSGDASVSQLPAYEAFLGRTVDLAVDYLGVDSWANQEFPSWQINAWAKRPDVRLSLGSIAFPTGGTWEAAASGAYDGHWRTLGERLVANGHGDARLRFAHEFNEFFHDYQVNSRNAPLFVQSWRRFVDILRSVPGQQFVFVWNPSLGDTVTFPRPRRRGRVTSTWTRSASARRRTRIRSRSCFATAGSSAGGSAWRTSSSGPRPSRSRRSGGRSSRERADAGDRGSRARRQTTARRRASRHRRADERRPRGASRRAIASDPSRQHLRHARRGRVPPRLHRQRALLRHRHVLDHRLRRRPRGSRRAADPLHRRSRGALPRRSGAHAARGRPGRAAAVHHRRADPRRDQGRTATRSRAARRRG